jgi:hypothetical protein
MPAGAGFQAMEEAGSEVEDSLVGGQHNPKVVLVVIEGGHREQW